jgi:hypothetical protein
MVRVLTSSVIDHGFEPRSGQIKDYEIGICRHNIADKNTALALSNNHSLILCRDRMVFGFTTTYAISAYHN